MAQSRIVKCHSCISQDQYRTSCVPLADSPASSPVGSVSWTCDDDDGAKSIGIPVNGLFTTSSYFGGKSSAAIKHLIILSESPRNFELFVATSFEYLSILAADEYTVVAAKSN